MFSHWAYLEPLRKYSSFIIVFVVSAVLCALALTYIYTEKYEAIVTLVFSPGEMTRLQYRGQDTQALGAPMPNADFKVIGKTLDALSISEAVLRKVVREHKLDAPKDKNYTGPWYSRYYSALKDDAQEYATNVWNFLKYGRVPDDDLTAKAVQELSNNIKITNQDSYVFLLKVRDKHPERVAAIADSLAKDLISDANESTKSGVRTRAQELESLAQAKLQEIDAYQDRINEFTRKNQITSPTAELDQGVQKYYDLQAEQLRLMAQIKGDEQKIESIKSKLKGAEESTRRGGAQTAADYLSSDDMKKLMSDKVTTEVELESFRARDASLRRSIEGLDRRLKALPDLKLENNQLNNELDRVNKEYATINIALHELKLTESSGVSEWQIQHRATVPTSPVTPVKIYHVGLAALLGICFAIGLVYVLTYFNVRLLLPSLGIGGRRAPAPQGDLGATRDRPAMGEGASDATAAQSNDLPNADIKRMPLRAQGGDR